MNLFDQLELIANEQRIAQTLLENRNSISYIIGKTVVAQTLDGPIYLSSVHEGKIEW